MRRACFVLLTLLALCACREPMFSRLSEQDANEIIAVLREHGITSVKVPGAEQSWGLEVDADAFPRAVAVLRENGLPRTTHASIGELFRKEGLVSTPSEERIRFVFAQQQELENTLSRIDGVITARVHVVIPNNDPLLEKPRPGSASVFIKHRADVDLSASVPQIKALVARSIADLPHENVSLSLFASRGLLPGGAVPGATPTSLPAWLPVMWLLGGALVGALLLYLSLRWPQRKGSSAPVRPVAKPVGTVTRVDPRPGARAEAR